MLKWLALWTLFAVSIIGDAMPGWMTEESSLSSHRDRRMINGTLVYHQEGAWQIALRALRNGSWYFAGSGSIISTKWALTVAHCVCNGSTPDPEIKAVSAGSIEAWNGTVHAIKTIICHPSYKNVLTDDPILYDIAVITVHNAFTFDVTTGPVSLPRVDDNFPDSVGVVRGWGSTQLDGYGMSQQLQRIYMRIVPEYDCKHYLHTAFGNSTRNYGQICALGLYRGYICYGDSGSPLIVDGILVGMSSWIRGDECAQTDDPAVFTSAATFRNWIKDVTGV